MIMDEQFSRYTFENKGRLASIEQQTEMSFTAHIDNENLGFFSSAGDARIGRMKAIDPEAIGALLVPGFLPPFASWTVESFDPFVPGDNT
jgi:hypothetical protein